MKHFPVVCLPLIVLLQSAVPHLAGATEFLIYQGQKFFSPADNGFDYYYESDSSFPVTWPEDWTAPDDYWHGRLEIHIELEETPNALPITLQACIWMHDADGESTTTDELESCAQVRTEMSGPGEYIITTNTLETWWHKDGGEQAIDISRPHDFKRMGMVMRTAGGCYISPYNVFPNCWGTRSEYLPIWYQLTIVAVSKGAKFSGWEHYLDSDEDYVYSRQLGWLYTPNKPWIWCENLEDWVYIPEGTDPAEDLGWVFIRS